MSFRVNCHEAVVVPMVLFEDNILVFVTCGDVGYNMPVFLAQCTLSV